MDAATLKLITPQEVNWPGHHGRDELEALCDKYADSCNQALLHAECTTLVRACCFVATIFEESIAMLFTEEQGSGQPYAPYIGRTLGQLTHKSNYDAFGHWCHEQSVLDDPAYFVDNPTALADPRWAWLGPAWYWVSHGINRFADSGGPNGEPGGFIAVSRAYNGGNGRAYDTSFIPNGWDTRQAYYDKCTAVGAAILPSNPTPPPLEAWMATNQEVVQQMLDDLLTRIQNDRETNGFTQHEMQQIRRAVNDEVAKIDRAEGISGSAGWVHRIAAKLGIAKQ